jgi:hypothetical protein
MQVFFLNHWQMPPMFKNKFGLYYKLIYLCGMNYFFTHYSLQYKLIYK